MTFPSFLSLIILIYAFVFCSTYKSLVLFSNIDGNEKFPLGIIK